MSRIPSSVPPQANLPQGAPLSVRAMKAPSVLCLEDLNEQQRQVVMAADGPLLVLAGAGTGKTRTLTARMAHLLQSGRVRPYGILAATFTNKAAREMKARVGQMLGQGADGLPWLGTFHTICARLLRRHAELVGLKANFTILDNDDQIRLLKQVIAAANIDEKRWPARLLAYHIDRWKNRALPPARVPAAEAADFAERGAQLYEHYQSRLRDLNAADFGDLLLHVIGIFQNTPDILARYQRWFRYVLVDEYQDTNIAQYLWLRLLVQEHRNICCVGDDDQSIYSWRGAEVGNILRFERDFPGAQVVRLEQNYRSGAQILAAASGVIAHNKARLGKTLWTRAQEGEKLRLIGLWDSEEEARWVGEDIEALQRGTRGLPPFDLNAVAILVRASHQMRSFEERFVKIGLPYRVIGGPRFYERLEIRDALAYFRLVVSPADGLAFERILNTPRRGLGAVSLQKIQRTARDGGVSMPEAARRLLRDGGIRGKGGRELSLLLDNLQRWRETMLRSAKAELPDDVAPDSDIAADTAAATRAATALPGRQEEGTPPHVALAHMILEESGYTTMWQNDKTPAAAGRLENLKELVKSLEGFANLQGFLEHVSLIMDNDAAEADAKVSLMTLHAAKGLEFPVVFLPGWEEDLFPSGRTLEESGEAGLEEERRLAYVGLTRAERICTVSFAANRLVYGKWQAQLPSRFVDELPEASVEVLTAPGIYGGGYGAATGDFGQTMQARMQQASTYNSPGWKRLQDRGRVPPPASGASGGAIAAMGDMGATDPPIAVGARVFHRKFGYGKVHAIENDRLQIAFDKAGVKHVMAGYVALADRP